MGPDQTVATPPASRKRGQIKPSSRGLIKLSQPLDGPPPEWIKGEPFASDFTTGLLHMVLPEGERWFCEVFTEALPYVRNEDLVQRMRGFIGQEATHAESHDVAVTAYLERRGVDTAPFLRQMEFAFRRILGPRTSSRVSTVRYNDIVQRLWLVAAIEHYTVILGVFVLNADWEKFDVAPTMADICRWHGAEEVEHRRSRTMSRTTSIPATCTDAARCSPSWHS